MFVTDVLQMGYVLSLATIKIKSNHLRGTEAVAVMLKSRKDNYGPHLRITSNRSAKAGKQETMLTGVHADTKEYGIC